MEIIVTLCEELPSFTKKNFDPIQQSFFPALVFMISELEDADSIETWDKSEEKDFIN